MTVFPVVTHRWDVSTSEAAEIQRDLKRKLVIQPLERTPAVVAGVDVSVRHGRARSAIVLLSLPELEPIEAVTAEAPTPFPYVPSLLAFREGPVILDALGRLETRPDVLVFDAHGYAHPRRMGLATHLGILLDLPAVGCAKSCLCGTYQEPDEKRGSWTPLRSDDEVIGAVVRTRDGVKPIFVSIGHRVDLPSAVSLVLACAPRYRLPETTRWADRLARGAKVPQTRIPTNDWMPL